MPAVETAVSRWWQANATTTHPTHSPIIAWSTDARHVTLGMRAGHEDGDRCVVFVFDIEQTNPPRTLQTCAERIALSPDGTRLATAQNVILDEFTFEPTFTVWDVDTGARISERFIVREYNRVEIPSSVLGGGDPPHVGRGRLWSVRVLVKDFDSHEKTVWPFAYAEIRLLDSDRLIIGNADSTVCIPMALGGRGSLRDATVYGHRRGYHARGDACTAVLDSKTGEVRTYDLAREARPRVANAAPPAESEAWRQPLASSDCAFVFLPHDQRSIIRTHDGARLPVVSEGSVQPLLTMLTVESVGGVKLRTAEAATAIASAVFEPHALMRRSGWRQVALPEGPGVRGLDVWFDDSSKAPAGVHVALWETRRSAK